MNTNTDCLFCRLSRGELPTYRVYEDDNFIVMLTIHPGNPGHVLVVTKEHVASFYDVEDALYTPLMLLVKRMARASKAVFQPLQVVMETSGIDNRHVHVHVLPVYSLYDRVPREVQEQQEAYTPAEEDLVKVAQGLAGYLATHPL